MVDPSKVEALVMGQVAKRKNEHEARNAAAKLTPQEKRDKKKRKLLEDTSKEMQARVREGDSGVRPRRNRCDRVDKKKKKKDQDTDDLELPFRDTCASFFLLPNA